MGRGGLKVHRFAFPNDGGSYILVSTKSAFPACPDKPITTAVRNVRAIGSQSWCASWNARKARIFHAHFPRTTPFRGINPMKAGLVTSTRTHARPRGDIRVRRTARLGQGAGAILGRGATPDSKPEHAKETLRRNEPLQPERGHFSFWGHFWGHRQTSEPHKPSNCAACSEWFGSVPGTTHFFRVVSKPPETHKKPAKCGFFVVCFLTSSNTLAKRRHLNPQTKEHSCASASSPIPTAC